MNEAEAFGFNDIRCPNMYFDFNAILAAPIDENAEQNPPFPDSFWDSDNETRDYFASTRGRSSTAHNITLTMPPLRHSDVEARRRGRVRGQSSSDGQQQTGTNNVDEVNTATNTNNKTENAIDGRSTIGTVTRSRSKSSSRSTGTRTAKTQSTGNRAGITTRRQHGVTPSLESTWQLRPRSGATHAPPVIAKDPNTKIKSNAAAVTNYKAVKVTARRGVAPNIKGYVNATAIPQHTVSVIPTRPRLMRRSKSATCSKRVVNSKAPDADESHMNTKADGVPRTETKQCSRLRRSKSERLGAKSRNSAWGRQYGKHDGGDGDGDGDDDGPDLDEQFQAMLKARNSRVLQARNMNQQEKDARLEKERQQMLELYRKQIAGNVKGYSSSNGITSARTNNNNNKDNVLLVKSGVAEQNNPILRSLEEDMPTVENVGLQKPSKGKKTMVRRVPTTTKATKVINRRKRDVKKVAPRGLTGLKQRTTTIRKTTTRTSRKASLFNDKKVHNNRIHGAVTNEPLSRLQQKSEDLQSILSRHNKEVERKRLLSTKKR